MLTNNIKLKKHIQLLLMGPRRHVQEYSLHLYIYTNMKERVEVIYKPFFTGEEGELRGACTFFNKFLLEYSCFTMFC